MDRLAYPLSHEWHAAINRHNDMQQRAGRSFRDISFMYEAKSLADEVPRMAMLFKLERESSLPKTHQQCSQQEAVPIKDNHLTCCLGVKARECPHLLALEKINRCQPQDIDAAKAWTCAAHIVGNGGDQMKEGYLLHVGDRMFWDSVCTSLAAEEE